MGNSDHGTTSPYTASVAPDEDFARDAGDAHQPAGTLVWVCQEREFFIDNLLVRIHFVIVMNRWTGLAPWEGESLFPGSMTSTFLGPFFANIPGDLCRRTWLSSPG